MATWVTHLMIAAKILIKHPVLERCGFSVGNVAPDRNIENDNWTSFTPSREVTHWMRGERKTVTDSDAFLSEYIIGRTNLVHSGREYSFLLGYYTHLITDGAFQEFIRNESRAKSVWQRIHADPLLCCMSDGYAENWDSV